MPRTTTVVRVNLAKIEAARRRIRGRLDPASRRELGELSDRDVIEAGLEAIAGAEAGRSARIVELEAELERRAGMVEELLSLSRRWYSDVRKVGRPRLAGRR